MLTFLKKSIVKNEMKNVNSYNPTSVRTPIIVSFSIFTGFLYFLFTNYDGLTANTKALAISSFVGAITVTWIIFGASIASKQLSLHIENQGISTFLKLLDQTNYSLSDIEKSITLAFSNIKNKDNKIEIDSKLHDMLLTQCSEDFTDARKKYLKQYVEIYLLCNNAADNLLKNKSLKSIFYTQRHEVFLNEAFKAVLNDLSKINEKN